MVSIVLPVLPLMFSVWRPHTRQRHFIFHLSSLVFPSINVPSAAFKCKRASASNAAKTPETGEKRR